MKPKRYKFQFNGDVDSCHALAALLKDGWSLLNTNAFSIADGYHWIHLEKWH